MSTSNANQRAAGHRTLRAGAVIAALLTATACTTTGQNGSSDGTSASYRQDRYQEIAALEEFRKCRDRALKLDRRARANGNRGRFLASAELLESCETELGPKAAKSAKAERMRAWALSIQNYIKGGNSAAAAERLQAFRDTFPDRDLYLANGASFTATMSALLGQTSDSELGRLSTLNTTAAVKDELRRMRHWRHN